MAAAQPAARASQDLAAISHCPGSHRRDLFSLEDIVLRDSQKRWWWQRLFMDAQVPAFVVVRPDADRHCPDCRTFYDVGDRYCPGCHIATPEWRFG